MANRWAGYALVAAGVMGTPAYAARSNCGGPPCTTGGTMKPTSVIPDPNEFSARGDLFSSQFTDLRLVNGFTAVNLGFSVNFGFGPTSTLFVNKNGAVSFGAPIVARGVSIGAAFAQADQGGDTRLTDLGVPVIAPYFGELTPGAGSGDGTLQAGDITVQYGFADPYADNGSYSRADLQQAVRITWYGLEATAAAAALGEAATTSQPVYAQLLIASDGRGLDSFEFRYGPPGRPGQADYGSVAGWALGNTTVQFSGPYVQGVPTFFEFENGQYLGQFGQPITTGVPEPATWAQLIAGFGLLGLAMRRRRVRVRVAYAAAPVVGGRM